MPGLAPGTWTGGSIGAAAGRRLPFFIPGGGALL
jgi:hypothetical protein